MFQKVLEVRSVLKKVLEEYGTCSDEEVGVLGTSPMGLKGNVCQVLGSVCPLGWFVEGPFVLES